ncbi:6-phosphogluconate dehydrogenase [Sphaerisporangium melleum]|uniref:6-phosphogluconate dehydrogenase n=1 Tax=Sphaerisporangium melleum TaxID=321316 RepID=A0A917RN06_9ACTN|nr:NAD(P)-dependent oxidoreductase [Sphaerisporangium melleum]GGL15709.1 6-phosphogluconate dehydrogenase [Sphaerisporangium melleum]GII69652.1 6-phosphogluconate dehydrogenase [Sphaerisporangium melleum]
MTTTTRDRTLTVGFIGLGDQGAPMAQAIGESEHALHVWARRPQSLDVLAGVPYVVHATPAELAAAVDVLALCLRDDNDIWDILRTPGVPEALRPGLIIVNHGTGDPGENRRIAEHLARMGVRYLDAPVSGGGPGARARRLTTICGGDRTAFDLCAPVFDTFSAKVAYMGPAGGGQTAKLLNNAMTMSNLLNAVDLVRLAARLGIGVRAVQDVIGASSGGSAILRALGGDLTPEIAEHLQGLMRKDIEHFADAMRAAGLDPRPLHDRGVAGIDGLTEAVGLIAAEDTRSDRDA